MSHTVKVSVQLKDRAMIERARERCGLPALVDGNHRLFQGQHRGLALQLPGWKHPVVIKPETGEAVYDNYNGSWGKQVELDKLCQAYAAEAAAAEFRNQGYVVEETKQEDQSLQLVATAY